MFGRELVNKISLHGAYRAACTGLYLARKGNVTAGEHAAVSRESFRPPEYDVEYARLVIDVPGPHLHTSAIGDRWCSCRARGRKALVFQC